MRNAISEIVCEKRKPQALLIGAALALIMISASCGYRLSGRGGLVPEGARSISIPVFMNGTSEPYVDADVTQAAIEEFLSDGRLRVASLEDADLALRGKIVRFEVAALSYSSDSYVQQYRVRLVVDASLEDRRTRKILWQERGIEAIFISDYPVALGDVRTTKISKETAVMKASQDIAWTLRSRVLEGF